MGSETSKYNHSGGIGIQLEKYSCLDGEEVNGVVYISLQKPIAPATLYLRFIGKESTYWEETHREHHKVGNVTIDRNVTSYYEGKKKVCNFNLL